MPLFFIVKVFVIVDRVKNIDYFMLFPTLDVFFQSFRDNRFFVRCLLTVRASSINLSSIVKFVAIMHLLFTHYITHLYVWSKVCFFVHNPTHFLYPCYEQSKLVSFSK